MISRAKLIRLKAGQSATFFHVIPGRYTISHTITPEHAGLLRALGHDIKAGVDDNVVLYCYDLIEVHGARWIG